MKVGNLKSANLRYAAIFIGGFLLAFLVLLALANGPSWLYVWRIPGFSISDKLSFILSSGFNVIRFSFHILPVAWLAISVISGYILAEYIRVRADAIDSWSSHYSWLAILLLAVGFVLVGFSAGVLFPGTNRFLVDPAESVIPTLVTILGAGCGILAAIYTYRWSKKVRQV